MRTTPCPRCGEVDTLRKIMWGMPFPPIPEGYYSGCCIVEFEYTHACINCHWKGHYVRGVRHEIPGEDPMRWSFWSPGDTDDDDEEPEADGVDAPSLAMNLD
jgi:hypothetical protein